MDDETSTDATVQDRPAAPPREDLTGIAEFRASVDDARARLRTLVSGGGASRWQLAGDVVALVGLAAMLLWMSSHDGGWEHHFFRLASGVVLVASPLAVLEARDLPRLARWTLAVYALGLVLALAFAGDRNEWVPTTLVMTVVPICGLLAHRIWRRPWGPAALVVLLAATFSSYWYRSFLTWWGDTLRGRVPLWRPLSWHNQSAILMGAFGAMGLAIAGVGRRYVAATGVLIAGGGLAGAWLSGSRGGLVATALGGVLAIVASVRANAVRGLAGPALSVVLAVGVVAGLNSMIQQSATRSEPSGNFEGTSTNPLQNRTGSAVGNFRARMHHMEAAVGMFLDDPVTGGGLGSYRRLGLQHTSPDANLTASAHNEYLEVPAETGLVGGLGFLGLHALIAAGAGIAVWRRREVGEDEIRGPLQVAGAVLAVSIGAHAAVDFDWTYPVLPVLLAVGAATLTRRTAAEPTETSRHRWRCLAAAPLPLLLAGALWGAAAERSVAEAADDLSAEEFAALPLAWQGDRLSQHALELSRRSEHELAASAIQEAMRWSPGVPGYDAVAQIVLYRAEAIDGRTLLGRLQAIDPAFGALNLAAEALIDRGDLALARALTEDLLATYDDHTAQGIDAVRAETWYLRAELEAVGGDCDAAAAQIARSVELGHVPAAFVEREYGPLRGWCPEVLAEATRTDGAGAAG